MYKDKVIGMIEIIQERVKKGLQGKPFTKENRELPTIGTKYEPGQTGFKLKKGYLLCDVVEVEKRDFAIKVGNNDTSISDFYGVHPLVGIIYAVGFDTPVFNVGDVILLAPSVARPGGIHTVVIDGVTAQVIHEGDVLGVDGNLTKFE